ncbi:MAG: alpha/beta hydrolase [Chitinophagales bacterium]
MNLKKIYLVPGLGADKRMYEPQLKVLRNTEVLEHQLPDKNMSLRDYARLLATRIDTSQPFNLLGTSLGGIVCIELSQLVQPDKIILINSVKNRGEMPLWMRMFKFVPLHRLASGERLRSMSNANLKRLMNTRDTRVMQLIRQMHDDADPRFIEWAVNAIIKWKPPTKIREDIVHLHGTADRLFPYRNIYNAIPVKGGSHIMNMMQPHDVNNILQDILDEIE